MNEQHPYKRVRFYEDSALENSIDVTNLLIEEFKISMETTGGGASWINGMNERHNRSIHNMVRSGLLGINQHEKNGAVKHRKQQSSIYAKYTVH